LIRVADTRATSRDLPSSLSGERDVVEPLAQQLLPVASLVVGYHSFTSIARLRGSAANLTGDRKAARGYVGVGISLATGARFHVLERVEDG
jgi:hypothetical protein